MTPAAQAQVSGSAFIATAVVNVAVATRCERSEMAPFTTTQIAGSAALISRTKSRPMSALERMRAQQAGGPQSLSLAQSEAVPSRPSYMPAIAAQTSVAAAEPIVPAARFGLSCASLFNSAASPAESLSKTDFLASRILPVSTTSFDAAWNRVGHGTAGLGGARAAIVSEGAGQGSLEDRIATVNRWVNAKVTYTSDLTLYGKADYWASAKETLRRGKGDCEDYAIAKMQLLAAIGVKREDMFLTIARDLVRHDDHAVLIVKLGDRAIMLDNATDDLLDGKAANDYRPILSFSGDRRFLHGY